MNIYNKERDMDVIKSRYGKDRSIEKLGDKRIRVMGESNFTRASENDKGVVTMFDFEGGPCFNLGGKIEYQNWKWTITKIIPEESNKENISSVLLEIK